MWAFEGRGREGEEAKQPPQHSNKRTTWTKDERGPTDGQMAHRWTNRPKYNKQRQVGKLTDGHTDEWTN